MQEYIYGMHVLGRVVIVPNSITGKGFIVRTSEHTAVVGLQWGDEGKGKVVDLLAQKHDVVVRYNGGANAGHTVVHEGNKYALHLMPSGVLHDNTQCVVGNGVVLDPEQFLKEKHELESRGINIGPDKVRISSRAHVVLPWHKMLDAAMENLLASQAGEDHSIGTTRRGIGPAYADKVNRATAIRVSDLLDEDHLRQRMRVAGAIKNAQLLAYDPTTTPVDIEALIDQYVKIGHEIAPLVCDTTYLLHDLQKAGKDILFEGANACLLDLDHGTFPYITSSNCSTLGIAPGTGLPTTHLQRTIGIVKAYSTRVGAGPFPTELNDDIGNRIRDRGHEYGTTTGRPRRCGWLDLVATKYSSMVCGATSIAVMLFDVLAGFDELKICTAYEVHGERTDRFLPDAHLLTNAKPVFETLPGFEEEIRDCRAIQDLPDNAIRYVERVAEFMELPLELVSVGPDRSETIVC